ENAGRIRSRHATGSPAAHRTNAPDPRAFLRAQASACRRHALRSRIAPARRAERYARAKPPVPALGQAALSPSAHRRVGRCDRSSRPDPPPLPLSPRRRHGSAPSRTAARKWGLKNWTTLNPSPATSFPPLRERLSAMNDNAARDIKPLHLDVNEQIECAQTL